jgi:hypothetical protein
VRGARRTSALSSAVRFFTISCISCCAASVVRCASAGGTWGHTRVESPGATRSFSSGSICRAHLRVSARATTASDRLDLLLLEVDALHGRPSVGTGVQRRRERNEISRRLLRQIVHSHARLLCSTHDDECPAVQERWVLRDRTLGAALDTLDINLGCSMFPHLVKRLHASEEHWRHGRRL